MTIFFTRSRWLHVIPLTIVKLYEVSIGSTYCNLAAIKWMLSQLYLIRLLTYKDETTFYPCLVLVKPRKTRSDEIEKLLTGM